MAMDIENLLYTPECFSLDKQAFIPNFLKIVNCTHQSKIGHIYIMKDVHCSIKRIFRT